MKKYFIPLFIFLGIIVGLFVYLKPYCEKVDILYSCINGQLDDSYYINDSQICTISTGISSPSKIYRNICDLVGLIPFLLGLILIFALGTVFWIYKTNRRKTGTI